MNGSRKISMGSKIAEIGRSLWHRPELRPDSRSSRPPGRLPPKPPLLRVKDAGGRGFGTFSDAKVEAINRRLDLRARMPSRRLTDPEVIQRLVDQLVAFGVAESDVDKIIVRLGPVDLDILAECKKKHQPPAAPDISL